MNTPRACSRSARRARRDLATMTRFAEFAQEILTTEMDLHRSRSSIDSATRSPRTAARASRQPS